MGINWPSNVNRTIMCPLFVGKLRLTYFLRISLLTLLNTLFTTSKTYLLLELLSISPQIWNLCSLHKFKSLLCNDCCNFAPSSFYEVNHFKFCNPHSWLTSYLSYLLTLVTLVEFILVAGRVIRCLTTSLANSLPGNWTSCSYNRKSEGCPVSKQETWTN